LRAPCREPLHEWSAGSCVRACSGISA
jgi:hypothetical protein